MKLKPFIISSLVLTFYALCPSALPGDYTLESPFTFSFQHRLRIETWDNAISLNDRSADATTYCAMAKRFATDAGFTVINEALQLHGGYGYIREYPLERLLRDARVHQILEGTNEIMRVIIARRMLDGDAPEAIR